MPTRKPLSIITAIDSHPIPSNQDEINELWDANPELMNGDPPSVDEAYERYTETIASYGEWHVFRSQWPFSHGQGVIIWNREFGEGFIVDEDEGEWHSFVNLFAAVVDEEGDCRDAEYSDSLQHTGAYHQRCTECGQSWTIG